MNQTITAYKFARINKNNFSNKGWEKQQINKNSSDPNPLTNTIFSDNTNYVEVVCGPDNTSDPRLIRGCVLLNLPTSNDPTLRRIRLRKGGYSGTLLSHLTELKYSTFIVHNINNSAPGLVLQVDINNNNSREFNIFFDPRIQNVHNNIYAAVRQNAWQQWDTLDGKWQAEPALPGFANNQFTLQHLVSQPLYANARIIDTPGGGHEGPGIRFTVGGDAIYNDFKGYLDAFIIGVNSEEKSTLHDFVCDATENSSINNP